MSSCLGVEAEEAPIYRRAFFAIAFTAIVAGCSRPDPAPAPVSAVHAARARTAPYLLLHDWYGESPIASPDYILDHLGYLDSLPFDGIAVYVRSRDLSINVSSDVMKDKPLRDQDIETCLAPLKECRFVHLTENFAAVFGGRPPDFMDDWSAPVGNFAKVAKAAKKAGLRGIYFDNETYYKPWGDHPDGVSRPDVPLEKYQAQARLRGRQVMEAMVKEYPDIVVILLHGPYISDPKAPSPLFPQWQHRNELLGPFFAGFVEGAGERATVVDGGELYQLRTDREFQESYQWRKASFSSEEYGCGFLSPDARARWPNRVKCAFGVYDRPYKGRTMNPDILATTLALALHRSDSYVWLYIEGPTFLKPPDEGGASREWIEAVRRAQERPTPASRP